MERNPPSNAQMNFPSNSINTAPTSRFLCSLFIVFLLILPNASIIAADYKPTNIGAIVDASSRKGKEEKTAMEIAISMFNRDSKDLQLFLHFGNSTGEPLQAASTAQELIREKEVGVIVGMDTWQEAALVADVGNRAQVPVLSLAASAIAPPLRQIRWPLLVQMSSNVSEQIECIAAIVGSYHWQRVIVVYEDDAHGGDSGMLAPLSEALQNFSSEIEYTVVLPPISSLSDPKEAIHEELMKLLSTQSRVFIFLKSSPLMATHLFQEARRMGFMARESAWIITDIISSFLDSIDTSTISYMEGALGIKPTIPKPVGPSSNSLLSSRECLKLNTRKKTTPSQEFMHYEHMIAFLSSQMPC